MTIKNGIYEHYKGRRYEVIGLAKHSETFEDVVVYKTLYDNELSKLWVRPVAIFLEEVELPSCDDSSAPGLRGLNGVRVPRFKYIGK